MKYLSSFVVFAYRSSIRLRRRIFSLLIGGCFAHFGRKTVVMYPLRLEGESRIAIGDHVFIGANSWLQTLPDGDNKSVAISIGNGTGSSGACVISAVRSVTLEESVLLARNVYISDHMHEHSDPNIPIKEQGVSKVAPVLIKRGAWLGQNVVVCPGVTIGQGAVIGANSVVLHDVPDFSVAVGTPAHVVKKTSISNLRLQGLEDKGAA
jgi:acetyltransferase-like isoleucine patch superfamily enzyme